MIASSLPLRGLCAAFAIATGALASNATAAPFVLAYTDGQVARSYTNLQAFYGKLSAVGLGSAYAMTPAGTIDSGGVNATTNSIIAFSKSKGLPLYPTVSDYSNSYGGFDPAVSNGMLATAAKRSAAVTNMVNLAVNNGFNGVNLDFEAVLPANKANYSAFVAALGTALRNAGKKLIISVPPMSADGQPTYLAGYDYAAIGAAVDYFQLMTYDEVGPGWSSSPTAKWPGPEVGLDWMRAKLNYAVSRVPPSKVLEGLPSYGYDYSTGNRVDWSNYGSVIAAHPGAVLRYDAVAATPYATWGTVTPINDGTAWSSATAQPVLWYDNAASITAKTQLVGSMALGGTSVWAMGYENAAFWDAVTAGLPGTVTPPPPPPPPPSGDTNIAPSGSGAIWVGNASATANSGKSAKSAVNDGNLSTTLILMPTGEGGAANWEAAGVTFAAAKTIVSAKFINGAADAYGNGYFQSGLSLQYTTNGSTWLESGWTVSPAYPNSATALNATYTFSGSAIGGVTGVRVSGRTGASSWSGAVKEVQVIGR